MRLGECKGMRDDDGPCVVIMGALSIGARRGDRLVVGNSLAGLMIAGSWPGVFAGVSLVYSLGSFDQCRIGWIIACRDPRRVNHPLKHNIIGVTL